MRSKIQPVLAILLGSLLSTLALAQDATLRFSLSGQPIKELSVSELNERIDAEEIHFYNYLMGRDKSYRAFPVSDLLDSVYGDQWRSPEYSDIAFTALDGYEAVSELATLRQEGGYLAFEDLDWETGWEPIGRKQADPGPFFLVWTGGDQTTVNAYPWPWQVVAINVLRFADQYPAVVPDVAENTPAWRGFEIYRNRCLRCHAIDQQGGKIGPDLNAPQSITAYRSEEMIKEFIRHPSKYRYTHMPDHPDLTDNDLDDLYRYLKHQAR